jgi:hypothetical protein
MLLVPDAQSNARNQFAVLSVPHPAAQPQALNFESVFPTSLSDVSEIGIDKKFQSFSFFCCSLCTEELGVFMQKKSVRLSVCPSVQYNLGL